MRYDDIIRLSVAFGCMLVAIFAFGYKFYTNENDNKRISKIDIIFLWVGVIFISFFMSNTFWLDLSIVDYLKSEYHLYILCLMMIPTVFLFYVVLESVLDAIAVIKKEMTCSPTGNILDVIKVVSIFSGVCIQLGTLRNAYNHENGGHDRTFLIVLVAIFLAINILVLAGFEKLKEVEHIKKKMASMRVDAEKQLEKYRVLNEKYEETSKIAHDVRKHLDILETLIKENDSEVEKYKEHLYSQLDKMTSIFKCENRILSIIMSQKMLEAELKNIKVEIDMLDVDFDIIDDMDMTTIFANLWDNAIEASMKLDEDRRKIHIIIGEALHSIIVSFENVYDGNIIVEGKKFLSSKGNGHGYGLTIIKEAIKKYKGTCVFEKNDNIFRAKITIPTNV